MTTTTPNNSTICDDGEAPDLAVLEEKVKAESAKKPRVKKQLFEITDAAAEQVKSLLNKRGKDSVGVRVSVRAKGCSGLSYTLEYADDIRDGEETVTDKGITIVIDPKATLFVIGTQMDFVKEDLAQGFIFVNPNEKGRCGCGESFHV